MNKVVYLDNGLLLGTKKKKEMNQIKKSGKLRINGRIDKENMVYLCRETLLDHKE